MRDKFRMAHTEIGWKGVEWIDLAPYREKLGAVVDTVVNKFLFSKTNVYTVSIHITHL